MKVVFKKRSADFALPCLLSHTFNDLTFTKPTGLFTPYSHEVAVCDTIFIALKLFTPLSFVFTSFCEELNAKTNLIWFKSIGIVDLLREGFF